MQLPGSVAVRRTLCCVPLCLGLLGISLPALGQSASAVAAGVRVTHAVDAGDRVPLAGIHQPAWATAEADLGAVSPSRRLDNLHLILSRAPAVEAAFQQLLKDQQDPSSSRYHQWLTPAQDASEYGVAAPDVAAVMSWLTGQGLSVDSIAAGGVFVTFSGTAAAVEHTFGTTLHNFAHDGAARYAITSELSVPAALSGVIGNVAGLNERYAHRASTAVAAGTPFVRAGTSAVGSAAPDYTTSSGNHRIGPNDWNTIYDVPTTNTGTGARAVVLIDSRINAADIAGYNSFFGLNVAVPTTIVLPSSSDPGVDEAGGEGEADLDTQRILGTAPGANVDLLVFATLSDTNIQSALQYEISTLNDPIVNMSFGECDEGVYENAAGTVITGYTQNGVLAAEQAYDSYFSAAAAQGISIFISSGDNAAADCDGYVSTVPTQQVLATNLLCASTNVTCVGGTEFADTANAAAYWSSSNTTNHGSALGYIPEGAWNEPTSTSSSGVVSYQALGTGGGVSLFAKPTYQAGTGVPADGFRDLPDVSFSASLHDGYIVCEQDLIIGTQSNVANCSTGAVSAYFGGTSAAAPSMAGIAALLYSKLGTRSGNLNPLLYKLAASTPAAFHDATPATSGVASCSTATPSMCNNSTPTATSLSGGLAGYPLQTGYDLATGLGSLDVAAFLSAASPLSTTLSVAAANTTTNTASADTFTATLTPASSTAVPTGNVNFLSNGTVIGTQPVSGNTASLSYTFTASGTYSVTAMYVGDSNFAAATSPAITVTVTSSPSFNLTPASTTLSIVSGVTTASNADAIQLTSVTGYSGTVGLTCAVTTSGTSTGTLPACSVAPSSVVLAANGSGSSMLTVTAPVGLSGDYTVVVTGNDANGTVMNSAPIRVAVTAPGYSLTASPSSLSINSAGGGSGTSTLTLTSRNGFAGNVALSCAISTVTTGSSAAGTCVVSPATVALTAGGSTTTTVTITPTTGATGLLTATVTGSGTTAGSTIPATATVAIAATLTYPTFSIAGTATSFAAGSTTGNTSALTVTSQNGFAGNVMLSCSVALAGGATASLPPVCALAPGSVTLAAGGSATAVATFTTTASTNGCKTQVVKAGGWTLGVASLLLLGLTRRRRGWAARLLGLVCVLGLGGGLLGLSGCGGGGTASTPCTPYVTVGTTAGTYTVTITGTGTSTNATAASTVLGTFTLTVN